MLSSKTIWQMFMQFSEKPLIIKEQWLPSFSPSRSWVDNYTVLGAGHGTNFPSLVVCLDCPLTSLNTNLGLFAFVALERKEQGQRVESLKAGIWDKLVWLLEGDDHFLNRTDELPRIVIMKHASASWGSRLQPFLSPCFPRHVEQSDTGQIVIVLFFPFHCKWGSYLL